MNSNKINQLKLVDGEFSAFFISICNSKLKSRINLKMSTEVIKRYYLKKITEKS